MSAHMQLHTNENMSTYGGFHQLGIPKMDGFRMENPIKIVDLGVPPFRKPPICQASDAPATQLFVRGPTEDRNSAR